MDCAEEGKDRVYVAETGRSIYVRGRQHLEAMRNPSKYKSNVFARHIMKEHGGRTCKIDFKMVDGF